MPWRASVLAGAFLHRRAVPAWEKPAANFA